MSVDQEISTLIQNASGAEARHPAEGVADALKEVNALFDAMGDSFQIICGEIEGAPSQSALKTAFGRLDKVMRIFFEVAPERMHGELIRDAVISLNLSDKLAGFMRSTTDPREALMSYKRDVFRSLATAFQRKKSQA